jgi:hypothetical protein
VAELEEEIATIVGAHTVDGEIRVGAVAAALSAGEPLRAIQLAENATSIRSAAALGRSSRSWLGRLTP